MKKSSQKSTCQHICIAQSQVGEVMVCPDCNVVHVALANMTLRFDEQAFAELAYMLSKAQQSIEHTQQKTQQTNYANVDFFDCKVH